MPIDTSSARFSQEDLKTGLHVLEMFSGITCGGLRTILEAGYHVSCYTSVEIDNVSRIIARKTLDDLQKQYPGQLPDKAIKGYSKRVPQDIQVIKPINLHNLIKDKGPIHFISGGWECQSMSMAGKHLGMSDERFMPFLDMIRICNFL